MKLYRYEAMQYSICYDSETEIYGVSSPRLELYEYTVEKETPKGYWIKCKSTWVSKTSRKRYAYPTKTEALESYRRRKLAYVKHTKRRLSKATAELKLCEKATFPC